MKKRLTTVIAAVLSLVLMACLFASCGEKAPTPTSVALNKTTAAVYVGETIKLTATVSDENGEKMSDVEVTWSSGDEKVATVKNGTVTGVADGTATITATVSETIKATCAVTVSTKQTVTITAPEDLELVFGEAGKDSLQLKATSTDNSAITWTSSDETAAVVDQTGKVTAQPTAGQKTEVTITASSKTAGDDTCVVTVFNDKSSYELTKGNNAEIIANKGVWYYFAKGAAAGHYGYAEGTVPTYSDGTLEVSFSFLEADESNELGTEGVVQWEFRYQPIFAVGTEYTLEFDLEINTDITFKWSDKNYEYKATGEKQHVTLTATVNTGTPGNLRVMTAGGTAEEPLETPMTIKLSNILVKPVVAAE